MTYFLDRTWCCLNEGERDLLDALLFEWGLNPEYITEDEFDILCGLFINPGLILRRQIVIWSFDLSPGIVDLPIFGPTPVFFFGVVFWPELFAFAISPGLACPSLCSILTYSA